MFMDPDTELNSSQVLRIILSLEEFGKIDGWAPIKDEIVPDNFVYVSYPL